MNTKNYFILKIVMDIQDMYDICFPPHPLHTVMTLGRPYTKDYCVINMQHRKKQTLTLWLTLEMI